VSVADVLAAGRAKHLEVMVEVCIIKRITGQALDANDVLVDTFTTIYPVAPAVGICRIKAFRMGHQTEAGQVAIQMRGYDLQLPWDAVGKVMRGDIAVMTLSDDAWVIGRPLTVTEVNYSGTQTARHILVEDDS